MLLNVKETEEQKIYITADPHLGHQRDFVWEARGYADWKAHDKGIIDTINSMVRPTDILLLLGDICLNTPLSQFEEYLSRIQCQNIWTMWGNHNNPHKTNVYRKTVDATYPASNYPFPTEVYPCKYKNLIYLGYYVEAVLNGQFVILCHYPISVFNEMQHGAWMLCGHSHYGYPLGTNAYVTVEVAKALATGFQNIRGYLSNDIKINTLSGNFVEALTSVMGRAPGTPTATPVTK
jgi:calcineurin-like phosphoesterase family protein